MKRIVFIKYGNNEHKIIKIGVENSNVIVELTLKQKIFFFPFWPIGLFLRIDCLNISVIAKYACIKYLLISIYNFRSVSINLITMIVSYYDVNKISKYFA